MEIIVRESTITDAEGTNYRDDPRAPNRALTGKENIS